MALISTDINVRQHGSFFKKTIHYLRGCAKHTTDYDTLHNVRQLHKYTQLRVLNMSVFVCGPTWLISWTKLPTNEKWSHCLYPLSFTAGWGLWWVEMKRKQDRKMMRLRKKDALVTKRTGVNNDAQHCQILSFHPFFCLCLYASHSFALRSTGSRRGLVSCHIKTVPSLYLLSVPAGWKWVSPAVML